tara:strand:- start:22224 stop:24017 length:1794 start_codon:yes stop_codon:yes gene_type:complete
MRKIFLIIFLFLSIHSFSQLQKKIDSLHKLTKIIDTKAFVDAVITIPYDEAIKKIRVFEKLTDRAIIESKKMGDSSLLAKSYMQKALALHFTTKEDEGLEVSLKAINIFKQLGDQRSTAKTYLSLGWKIKYRNLNDAFLYMKKGVDDLEKLNIEFDLIGAYNNFGVLYQMKNQLDSALYLHEKSLFLSKKIKDSVGIPFAHTYIADVFIKQKEFVKAKKHLDTSLIIRVKKQDIYGITDSYLYLGDLFFHEKNFSKAIQNFKSGYKLAKENNYFPLKKYAAEYLHKSYDSLNDLKNSLNYLKEFQSLKDSILNYETNQKIEELQIEFETLEKEKEITEQKIVIQNKNLFTIILIASIFILSILSWTTYKRQQFKRKQLQKELDLKDALTKIRTQNKLQEQRLEISRDLHDNIGSQLTFIISSIDNIKYASKDLNEKLKEKLAGISSFTFDTIHQLRDTIWAMNKNQITFVEFHSRVLSYIEKVKTVKPDLQFDTKNTISDDVVFSSVQGMNLFRVIQESINNSLKHADATTISINFDKDENQLSFIIKDNGKGFDKENIDIGNGLSNIENRISSIEGEVFINSVKNEGTSISIKVPI